MCIDRNQLQSKVKEFREYKRILEEAKNQLEAIQADITELMETENTDILTGDDFKITWKTYVKNNFDSKAFKEDIPELYAKYLKETSYKKFLVS